MMPAFYRIAGLAGSVCLLFGAGYYLSQREFTAYVLVNLLLGAGLVGAYAYRNLRDLAGLFNSSSRASRGMLGSSALVLAAVVAVNLLSGVLYYCPDLTRDRVSTISDQSRKAIKWIKEPLEIIVFRTGGPTAYERFLVDSYHGANRRITGRFIDPEKNPQAAQDNGINRNGQAVVAYKDSHERIPSATEQNITNAVIRMTQPAKNIVYFLQGHGEHLPDDLSSTEGYGLLWRDAVAENYTVMKLKLEPPNYYIPGNCTILVIGGPKRAFTSLEVAAVREYLEAGGRALILADPDTVTGLEGLLAERNVRLENDCFVDVAFPSLVERSAAMARGIRPAPKILYKVMVNGFPDPEIARDLAGKALLFSVARTLSVADAKRVSPDLSVRPLALTTNKGWGETGVRDLFARGAITAAMNERRGPLIVAMASIKGTAEANSKIIVIGDSDFVSNEYYHQLYNRDFFLNCMAWLSNQSAMISVRPRHLFASRLDYDPAVMSWIFTVSVLIFPQLLLIAGIAIWRLRRQ